MAEILRATSWDSRIALTNKLRDEPSSILLEGEKGVARRYYSFSVNGNNLRLLIGVATAGLGTDPIALLFESGRCALVGYDTWLSWIDVSSANVVSTRALSGVFYKFVEVPQADEIVVIHEIGVVRVDANGAVKWSVDTDIIEESSADANGNLIVHQFDGPLLKISMSTGVVLHGEA